MNERKKKQRKRRLRLAAAGAALLAALSVAACGNAQKAASADAPAAAAGAESAVAETTNGEITQDKLAATEPTGYSFGTFRTVDLDGNEVDESIFAQTDYTLVNFWGTFCPPCIAEMPDLAKLQAELPENIQMIGLICDLYYEQEADSVHREAEAIVSEADVTYTNLLVWQDALQMINSFTAYVPTTFFVDSEGNLVGDPIIGADINAYKDRIIALAK